MSLWVAREILPHENRIRGWFLRNRVSPEDVDELLQEAYCRIARIDSFEEIASPPAYFFSIARNLLLRKLKRASIVSFEEIAELESFGEDPAVSLEEVAHHRMAYEKVMHLISSLPERCRRIVELRKIEGWSQKEIATHLNITEKAVEKQIWVGVRAVREAWQATHHKADEEGGVTKGRLGKVLQ
ncbi:RNA polymerase sigma factor [Novosphingobium rosa]|uniref:RNA polymerase sigma factor n=1 Tax=Novosphingobium rosa TaxID=76978 RepID=UPI000830A492|nr:RNA polymerase sigma factor [Novosphingobium rosa]